VVLLIAPLVLVWAQARLFLAVEALAHSQPGSPLALLV
jgi:hypothetical protein